MAPLVCTLFAPGFARADLCPAPAYASASSAGGTGETTSAGTRATNPDGIPEALVSDPNAPIEATADRVTSDDGEISLEGNTSLIYQGRRLLSENARYKPDTGEVAIDGELEFLGQGIALDSSDARFDLDDNLFDTGRSNYELDLNGKRATGSADKMSRNAAGEFRLDEATYSTCPPGDNSWQILARRITLYPDRGFGYARNIRLKFKGVPILAIPAFSFPISSARKTGFLAPIFARGEQTGLELLVPWYWNIRPNLDATLTPRLMSKRGAQLQSEVRYLNTQGIWTLDAEYLNDRELDGVSRSFLQLEHSGSFNDNWTSSISAARVSDSEYFEDLGDSLQVASISHLERIAELRYADDTFNGLARLQNFQTIDEEIAARDRPYQRLPQLKLSGLTPTKRLGVLGRFDSEYVYFDHDDNTTGSRVDLQPGVSLPLSGDAWFVTPSIKHRLTYYELDNRAAGQPNSTSRSLGIYSIDSGLFFDRQLDDQGSVQTLEPRLYYLRVPFRDQDRLPLFDSSAFDFNIGQLFRENRFTGADRVADANQLSMALTTRFIDGSDGSEPLRASIGQILYFDDRRVDLDQFERAPDAGTFGAGDGSVDLSTPDSQPDTSDVSDIVGEVSTEFADHWMARGNVQWNPDSQDTIRASLLVSYRPGPDRIINVSHRRVKREDSLASSTDPDAVEDDQAGVLDDENTEQVDISFIWPLFRQYRLAGRYNYSIDADTSIESLIGVEYDSCCWAFRFAARRYISENGEDHDTSLYLQLVLKGLAPLGQNYGALLENAVLGYRDDYD